MPTRSAAPSAPEILAGPVSVCIDRPILALDIPFTYDLPIELGAGVGSLVRVRFHGKLTRGWVLGPTDDIPARMLPVTKIVSPVRAFDASMLELYRWLAERYVAPLATVIGRGSPPRVASEEVALVNALEAPAVPGALRSSARCARSRAPGTPGRSNAPRPHLLSGYIRGADLHDAIEGGSRGVRGAAGAGGRGRARGGGGGRLSGCGAARARARAGCVAGARHGRRRSGKRSGTGSASSSEGTSGRGTGPGWRSGRVRSTSSSRHGRACSPRSTGWG